MGIICDRFGLMRQVDAGFSLLLNREWPAWSGAQLRDEITARERAVAQRPARGTTYNKRR